jgi:hypothetical protein
MVVRREELLPAKDYATYIRGTRSSNRFMVIEETSDISVLVVVRSQELMPAIYL